MLEAVHEPLRMRHQAEDPARRVAHARGRERRAVGVGGILLGGKIVLIGVFEDDLAGGVERFESFLIGHQELALTVGDGQLDRL